MAAAKTTAKTTTKGARAKVQAKSAVPAKTASRASTAKTTARAATGAKTTRGARAKVAAAAPVSKPVTPPYPTAIADKKPWTNGTKVNKKTGFTEGTISDIIATALLKGGKSRTDIVYNIPNLPTETRKGTKFQAANVAATIERQMKSMGFEVVQSYKLVPPKRAVAK